MAKGNPAKASAEKKAEELRISQIGDFKKRLGGIFELPSGLVVKLKNPGGMQAFLKAGTIPNSLMGIIKSSMDKGTAPSVGDFTKEDNTLDPEILSSMTEMLDQVALATIVAPTIFPLLTQADIDEWNSTREEGSDSWAESIEDIRQDDRLYVDELPMDDKQFIFQWINGGTTDLETFRKQQREGMETVGAVQGLAPGTFAGYGVDQG